MKAEALKEQTTASRPTKALIVYPPNTPATLVPRVLPTKSQAITKEVKEMKEIFKELEAEVDQHVVDRKHDEIERKNLLIANDNLIADCLFKDVFHVATNSELNVSSFTKMHDAHTIVKARCLELEAKLSKLRDKIQQDNHNELVKPFSNLENRTTALLTENESLKVQIQNKLSCVTKDHVKPKVLAPEKYAIDVEPIPPCNRNNREVHLYYLKHLKESVETLREIVEEDEVERPLDNSLTSACLYTKHSQELSYRSSFGILDSVFKTYDGDRSRSQELLKKDSSGRVRFGMGPLCLFSVEQFCDSDLEVTFRKQFLATFEIGDIGFTLVKFLRSKDETPEVVIKFLKQIQVGLNKTRISSKDSSEGLHRPERVFGALCYPTNDSEDLGKLQPTADIGIFVGYAPSRKGIGPAPTFLTPGHISSSLVPNPVPAAPYVPPTNKDLDILFQPMFDEYLEPPRVERPVSPAPAVQVPVNSTGTPSSTTIDQDAPSPSHSPSSSAIQSPSLHQGVADESTFMEENPFAPTNNDPFINLFAPEPRSEASSSRDLSSTESPYVSQTLHHLGK
ncbi:hypothetical protein Tco_1456293 [Tanacetum coccineum]